VLRNAADGVRISISQVRNAERRGSCHGRSKSSISAEATRISGGICCHDRACRHGSDGRDDSVGGADMILTPTNGEALRVGTRSFLSLLPYTCSKPHQRPTDAQREPALLLSVLSFSCLGARAPERTAAKMATTYENMVLREMHRHEHQSKKEWGKQHAADSTVFGLETSEFARLEGLKEKVADLCDLQPTPAAMVRPPRKVCVRSPRTACARVHAPMASNNEPAAWIRVSLVFVRLHPLALPCAAAPTFLIAARHACVRYHCLNLRARRRRSKTCATSWPNRSRTSRASWMSSAARRRR
jgi:hypothetical protein